MSEHAKAVPQPEHARPHVSLPARIFQAKEARPGAINAVPPSVHDVLRSPGDALDSQTRIAMEQRFGHDFSQVRIHTDTQAAASAQDVRALAYTVGRDVVFGAGQYEPTASDGQRLLAHELTHVVQQSAIHDPTAPTRIAGSTASTSGTFDASEREAEAAAHHAVEAAPAGYAMPQISQHPVAVYRQQASLTSAPATMTRDEFAAAMRKRFGMVRIRVGTQTEQATELTPQGGAPAGGVTLPNWQQWDPGQSSPVYLAIMNALDDFNQAIGGIPVVNEVVFYATAYQVNPAGVGVAQPNVGASFGAGQLTVYRSATTMANALPISRSNPQGNYPPVGVGVGGIPGQSPGAPLPLPTQAQSTQRTIAHELGHGLAEAAMGPTPKDAVDPGMMDDYQREVGWTAGKPPELFDVGVPAVATALQSGSAPPSAYHITEGDWNEPKWVEQPLTHYSVVGGPSEDFAEAVMAFIYEPNLLLSRSPHRFKFLYSRKERWLPRLLKPPQIGDFPAPRGDTRVG